jgi:type VI secretion system protein
MMNKHLVAFLACCLALGSLSGCSSSIISAAKSIAGLTPGKVWIEKVQFRIDDEMNDNSPVSVHLLIIYKQDVYDELSTMPSEDYFAKTAQLRRDNPNMIDFFTWDVVPGQAKEEQDIVASRADGVGVLIFARYKSPGDHRVVLADDRQIRLVLEKLDFHSDKIPT